MTDSFEIQRFVETGAPVETITYAKGRGEAIKEFVKALENNRGKSIRVIQVVIDFTTMEAKE